MPLADLLQTTSTKKIGVSLERIAAIKPILRQYIAFWREYPDLFIDFLCGLDPDSTFQFYFYQRVLLRQVMRHQYTFDTFPRGYSKSFMVHLVQIIRCVLYPGSKIFVASGGKAQSASIIEEKVQEICQYIPAIRNEINWEKGGGTSFSKDQAVVTFRNGSVYDNVAASQRSRGKRRHAGVLEEAITIDGQILQEVLVPMMSVARKAKDGRTHREETLSQSQCFITTAGWRQTFCYDKLIQTLVGQALNPDKYSVMGGTYKIPVLAKLYSKDFIKDLKAEGTFNESSFEREFCSHWSGAIDSAFFSGEDFEKHRKLKLPEYEYSIRPSDKNGDYYVIAADIGRKGCSTVVNIFRVRPFLSHKTFPLVQLVNIVELADTHIEEQIILFKRLFYQYRARAFVIDGNGLGAGWVDLMITPTEDHNTGESYPAFGVINDPEGYYSKYRTADLEDNALYIIKAHPSDNTEAYMNARNLMSTGKLQFLVDERTAKAAILKTKAGEAMRPEERQKILIPYTHTSILKDELLNLKQKDSSNGEIRLVQNNSKIPKDHCSSFFYGLLYIKRTEDTKKHKRKFNASDWKLFN